MGNPINTSTQTDQDDDLLIELYYARYQLRKLENKLSELERLPTRLNRTFILKMIDRTRDDIILAFNKE